MHLIALQSYEVQLKLYAHQLERLIAQSAGKPTNINQYIYWFSFDVMGQFAFSKPFDMLIGKRWHHAVQMLRAGLALVGPLSPTPWLVRLAVDFPVVSVVRDFQKMEAWCADQMDERIEVRNLRFHKLKSRANSLQSEHQNSQMYLTILLSICQSNFLLGVSLPDQLVQET